MARFFLPMAAALTARRLSEVFGYSDAMSDATFYGSLAAGIAVAAVLFRQPWMKAAAAGVYLPPLFLISDPYYAGIACRAGQLGSCL